MAKIPADCPGPEDCTHPDRRNKWYLDKGVSLPTLLTIVGMLIALGVPIAGYLRDHEHRLTQEETETTSIKNSITAAAAQRKEDKADLKADVAEVKMMLKEIRDDLRKRK